jgi:hypothetical protein
MASNINPYSVDGTFPIAGQDNSSQGFRDNFTNIQNNFIAAENEISDLQTKALVTSALNGQNLNNDMAGTQIRRPQLSAWTQSYLDLGAVNGTAILDFGSTSSGNGANFQKITTAGPVTLNFINWPATVGTGAVGYGVMRVWIVVTNVAHTVTLPANVDIAVVDIAGYDITTQKITFDAPGNYIFDISSINSGADYLIFDVTRNRASLRDPKLYYNDQVNSTLMVNYGSGFQTAMALEQGQDSVSSLGSFNSVAVGNIQLANVAYTQFDTGSIGGYSVTGARGNLTSLSYVQPVHSSDLLGYVNGLAYTGSAGTSNVFQQVASIDFFATGSNVAYGLGGNIAFFTADDGGQGANKINQAIGIENDQSVKFFGNVITANTYVPSSYTAGGVTGQISYDANYIYICLGPNNWKRANIATW